MSAAEANPNCFARKIGAVDAPGKQIVIPEDASPTVESQFC
jgi:hypothetical protein